MKMKFTNKLAMYLGVKVRYLRRYLSLIWIFVFLSLTFCGYLLTIDINQAENMGLPGNNQGPIECSVEASSGEYSSEGSGSGSGDFYMISEEYEVDPLTGKRITTETKVDATGKPTEVPEPTLVTIEESTTRSTPGIRTLPANHVREMTIFIVVFGIVVLAALFYIAIAMHKHSRVFSPQQTATGSILTLEDPIPAVLYGQHIELSVDTADQI